MFKQGLEKLKKQGLLRCLREVQSAQGARIILDGRQVINLCSNNYLGLANHPLLKEAAIKATQKYGAGTSSSRLISGTTSLHKELEAKIAEFKNTEAALVFNSGYAANLGIISALVGRGDVVFSDKLNHASIVDGCLLSRAEFVRYAHRDIRVLEGLIREYKGKKKGLIVTDTVFSMDGDIAPLPEIVNLAKKYDCALMVDEAHATGVLGENGRGAVEHFNIKEKNIIHMGTLSKALGSFGAYVAGAKELINYLINKSRPFIYTTALPVSSIAAAIVALDIIKFQPQLRKKLWDNVKFFKEGLKNLKIGTAPIFSSVENAVKNGRCPYFSSQTQIIPVLIGDNNRAVRISEQLLKDGIFIQAIRPPTVPKGQARLRITVTAEHSKEDLEFALEKLSKLTKVTLSKV